MTVGVDPIYRMMNDKPIVIGYVVVNQTVRTDGGFHIHQLASERTAVRARETAARYAGAKAT